MHCPSLNIFGTFFPAWMLCALVGIVFAAIAAKLLTSLRLDEVAGPKALVLPSLGFAVTAAVWLNWYGH